MHVNRLEEDKTSTELNNRTCFQACRDAKIRQEKTEEEVNELNNKSKTLEVRETDIHE